MTRQEFEDYAWEMVSKKALKGCRPEWWHPLGLACPPVNYDVTINLKATKYSKYWSEFDTENRIFSVYALINPDLKIFLTWQENKLRSPTHLSNGPFYFLSEEDLPEDLELAQDIGLMTFGCAVLRQLVVREARHRTIAADVRLAQQMEFVDVKPKGGWIR